MWCKRDIIWTPSGHGTWAHRFATCPTPIMLDAQTIRVFVQCRDTSNVGRVAYVDVDAANPSEVRGVSADPVLDVGEPGAFDDAGTFPTSVLRMADGTLVMYYVGFELCSRIRYRLLTGIAVSDDNGRSFRRVQSTPILERSPEETTFRCGPHVVFEDGIYRMWYVAGSAWVDVGGRDVPSYDIRYMESVDGRSWPSEGQVVLTPGENEYGFGRPYVCRENDAYEMYFSVRTRRPDTNRLAYAISEDGLTWHRRDQRFALATAESGWDRDGASFPSVVTQGDRALCFYNGPNFGEHGFGWAERALS